jgi:hypothetical protein
MVNSLNLKIHIKSFLIFGLVLGLVSSCEQDSTEEALIGKWQMNKILQHDNDVSAEHNPNNDRWIEFFADKTFKTGGTPFGDNHGTWYLKDDNKVLYLDSSVENDDSEWRLTVSGDEMLWTGIGDPGKEAFTLIYSRPSS